MKVLFVDDEETRHGVFKRHSIGHSVDHVLNADEAIKKMSEEVYDLIFLDHDLCIDLQNQTIDGEKDGRYIVRWMVSEYKSRNALVVCHSLNFDGRQMMLSLLKEAGFNVLDLPFAWYKFPWDQLVKQEVSE